MRRRVAKLISDVLNPFLVSFVMLILISFQSTTSTSDALKWSLISIALSTLPIFLVIVFLVRNRKLDGIFVSARRQRNKIYLLATVCIVVGYVVFSCLGAPSVLVATFVAGLSTIVIFMFINLSWKISVHTAFITSSVAILIVLYGAIGAVTAVLLPLVAWSRIEMGHHSPAQVVTAVLLAALTVVVVFYFFGIIGPVTPGLK